MSRLNRRTVLGVSIALALGCGTASATNGYFTLGAGTQSKAMAGSGSADPQELMALATNPAGLAALRVSTDAGIGLFAPHREYKTSESMANGGCSPQGCAFTIGPNDINSGNPFFVMPFVAANWRLDEQSALAVAFYGRGGMNTRWKGGTATFDPSGGQGPYGPMTFPGTYGSGAYGGKGNTGVDLMQGFLNTTYAWKTADDRFALGVSAILAVQLFEAQGVQTFAPYTKAFVESGFTQQPKNLSNNGHDTSYGYGGAVGGIWNINRMFSLAAAYTTKMSMSKFSDYSDLFAGDGSFDIPSTATYGLTVRPTESLTFSFDYQDIWYSDVDSVHNPMQNLYGCPSLGGSNPQACLGGNQGPGFGWEDMSVYKFGFAWQYDPAWTFRAGYSFADHQPIPKDQMTFNILAPGVIEQHITLGFTREAANGNLWNFAAVYAPNKKIKGPNNFDPTQTVELSMYQFEFEMSYSWGR